MANGKRRYKVIEKSGGMGEVIQIMVHDVGVNTGDNLPPLLVTSARGNGASYASASGNTNQSGGGLIAPLMQSSCSACALHRKQIWELEAKIDSLVSQMHLNNVLNALLAKVRERESLVKSILPNKKCNTQQQQSTELADYVEGELMREGFLHALMNLLSRPTRPEEVAFFEKNTSASVRSLKKEIQIPQ